ncbi:hypothetical protein [Acetanaerobacterium elongatum]|nr:hypothetical protein [Acetanaerobacterium elongatum]
MITPSDVERLSKEPDEALCALMNSKTAAERTAAVRILSQRCGNSSYFISTILELLRKEQSLYTKLEICTALENGSAETARVMVNYLGAIGSNQHKTLPDKVSQKKSYPLARDIIARSLASMSPAVFGVLLEVLAGQDEDKISEAIDAAGYMVFYNQQLATEQNARVICSLFDRFHGNPVIVWKAITCLSAFPLQSSIKALQQIKERYPDTLLYSEACRSLKLIDSRLK